MSFSSCSLRLLPALACFVALSGCPDGDDGPPTDGGVPMDAPIVHIDSGHDAAPPSDAALPPTPDEIFGERIRTMIAGMTLEEKALQIDSHAPAIPRLGLPAYDYWSESLHGVARAGLATVFPQTIGLAASWDEDLITRVATAISDEGRAKFHETFRTSGGTSTNQGLTFFAPNVNLLRDPRWGRGHETLGEDPVLTARIGSTYVRAMQGDHPLYLKTVTTGKHFAVHSGPEATRHSFDARVSQRDLAESYLPHFHALVNAGVYSIMAAYNRVNGEACMASPTLLQQTLRDRWHFGGYVVADCYGIEDIYQGHHLASTREQAVALAIHAGTDLDCGTSYGQAVQESIRQGLMTEADVDRILYRILMSRFRLGLFDDPSGVPWASTPMSVVDSAAHRALALEASRESIVLLKNTGTLPLSRTGITRIAVIGPSADSRDVLLGSYHGDPSSTTTVLQGIRAVAGAGITIESTAGCDTVGTDRSGFAGARAMADRADVVVAVLGLTPRYENETDKAGPQAGDRTTLELPGVQEQLLEELAASGKPIVLVLTGGPFSVRWANDHVDAILAAFYPGQDGGRAVADVLFGDENPSGHLPMTYYANVSDLPAFDDYAMARRTYRFSSAVPLYPFGHGLSYTTFQYSNLVVPDAPRTNAPVDVRVDVQNTGSRPGAVVAQAYVRLLDDTRATAPKRALAGFARAELAPGERRTLTIRIAPHELGMVDDTGVRTVLPGRIALAVGSAQPGADMTYVSDSTGLSATFALTGEPVDARD